MATNKKVRGDSAVRADTDTEPKYSVCKGKAITTKRGILADGQAIMADDLAGGAEALDAFVDSGHIAKG